MCLFNRKIHKIYWTSIWYLSKFSNDWIKVQSWLDDIYYILFYSWVNQKNDKNYQVFQTSSHCPKGKKKYHFLFFVYLRRHGLSTLYKSIIKMSSNSFKKCTRKFKKSWKKSYKWCFNACIIHIFSLKGIFKLLLDFAIMEFFFLFRISISIHFNLT